MKKRRPRKLVLRKETLTRLELRQVAGGGSVIIKTVYSTEPVGCEPVTETCQSNCAACPV